MARTDAEIKQWIFGFAVQCSKEHPVTMEELQMMYKHKIPDHQNAKCLLACTFRKTGWLDSNGMFDIKKAYELAETDYADDSTKIENSKKVFEICKTVNDEQVGDDEKGCDRAYLMAKCMADNGRKMGFQI
ncbi:general odorant-binding protein 19d isoform X2 [Manduca sexta]|uniref:general odorant-binding protein 19d isoform X2 n=1 Tax=Manduca sexta TaxID=7130 RepID=UPI001183342A|nr:general odorant-binding protein 19d isoform X2 [Manduca sexta]